MIEVTLNPAIVSKLFVDTNKPSAYSPARLSLAFLPRVFCLSFVLFFVFAIGVFFFFAGCRRSESGSPSRDWPLVLLPKMEAVIEKECGALGGLFQVVIGDMKVSGENTPYCIIAYFGSRKQINFQSLFALHKLIFVNFVVVVLLFKSKPC